MIMSLALLKVTVFFIYPCFNMVSFRRQKKPGPRPDWSPLGVSFEISNGHPCPFYMGVSSRDHYTGENLNDGSSIDLTTTFCLSRRILCVVYKVLRSKALSTAC